MYLSDKDIRSLLAEIAFETDDPQHLFDPGIQIQPSSVDLRLDRVFWKPTSGTTFDLRRAKLLELSPRRHWRRIALAPGESLVLKPRGILFARTYEAFGIPTLCAGKIEGRSSFARMGLGIHCTSDFINPGWHGHMPMQLVNFGPNPIRLFPYLTVCQVMFIKLSSPPVRVYGATELASKYMEDDGGPSYWWRDKRIAALHRSLGEHDVGERIQKEVLELIGPQDPDLIERFEQMVQNTPSSQLTNADELLDEFVRAEDRRRVNQQILHGIQIGAAPMLIGGSIGSVFTDTFGWLHFVLWAATTLSIPVAILGIRRALPEYLGVRELNAAREAAQKKHAADGAARRR